MNTYLLGSDKSITRTTRSAIVEKSNNIEDIQFISPILFGDYDLSEFDLILQYKLPVSQEVHIESLTGTVYKNDYLLYTLPTTAKKITSEPGDVEMSLSMVKVALDSDGNQIRYVLNYTNTAILPITPLTNWFVVPDDGLSELADLYLANKALAQNLAATAATLNETKADNFILDMENNKIYLTANGERIGNEMSIEALSIELKEYENKTTTTATNSTVNL